MAANVSISGRKRHAKSVIYLYFADSDSLHMPVCLVSSACRFAVEQCACRGINRPATQDHSFRAFHGSPRRSTDDNETTCTGSGEAARFLDRLSKEQQA